MKKDTLYQKIMDYLKGKISSGELKIGDAVYSENLLCEQFGVSRTSVRKAIRLMIEENLLESRQGKGTFIRGSGQGIIHNAVCLLNHWSRALRLDMTDSYYSSIIYSSENTAREHGLNFQIFSRAVNTPEEAVKAMKKLAVDGLLIDANYQDYFEDLSFFRKISPNLVIVDGSPTETDLPVVAHDSEKGFSMILADAVKRNRPIAFLYHEQGVRARWQRDCFLKAADKLGVKADLLDYGKNISFDTFVNLRNCRKDHYPLIFNALTPWLKPAHFGGTIVCSKDYEAVKTLGVLQKCGYCVPADFAVTGFGGMHFSTMTDPELTTVMTDSRELGAGAANMLFDIINGTPGPRKLLLEPGYLKRKSA